jgi:hypothetical protein
MCKWEANMKIDRNIHIYDTSDSNKDTICSDQLVFFYFLKTFISWVGR